MNINDTNVIDSFWSDVHPVLYTNICNDYCLLDNSMDNLPCPVMLSANTTVCVTNFYFEDNFNESLGT